MLKEKKGGEETKGKCASSSEQDLSCTGLQMIVASAVEAGPWGAFLVFDAAAIE